MKIIITNNLQLTDAPEPLFRKIRGTFTIENPAYLDNAKMGRWQGRTDHWLTFYENHPVGLTLPRGAMGLILTYCRDMNIRPEISDRRRTLPKIVFQFSGALRDFQKKAVDAMLRKDFGTLSAPTASGKTCMALYMIVQRQQPTLIVVHTKELLAQWVERIWQFLSIPKNEVGIIGGGKKRLGQWITVALVQSLCKCTDEVKNHIGFLVVDEAHHCPSKTFTDVVSRFDCRYQLGLSATLYRRDKLNRLIFWYLGDCHHEIKKEELLESGDLVKWEVINRETSFIPFCDPTEQYSTMISELCEDQHRNELISGDVAEAANNGGEVCLILSDRKGHCRTLADLVADHGVPVSVLTGDTPTRERKRIVEALQAGKIRVLASTTQLLSEGFDAPSLRTLFMVTPVRFEGKVIQTLGRILRPSEGKNKAVVFDYHDINVGVLMNAARARQRVYQQMDGGTPAS